MHARLRYSASMRTDVIILGGGLVGLTLAIALDAHGIASIVIDPAEPSDQLAPSFDGRASAVASAPWRMLQAIGVGARLDGHGCPIAAIKVSDGIGSRGLTFTPDTDDGAVGIMFENRRLRLALREAAVAATKLTLLAPAVPAAVARSVDGVTVTLADGREVRGALLVGAEGRNSPTREAAGIRVARWQYDHAAIIGTVRHERPHDGIAHEIFYPQGPFAILPLNDDASGHRSAIVWTVERALAPAMLALSPRAFAAEAQAKMGGLLGDVSLASPLSSYPLGFHHAAKIVGERLALVGDAAHGIHPIAGQGANLGYRDVAALVEVLVDGARLGLDFGDAQTLARYDRWRSVDTFLVASSTDALTRLFGIRGRPAAAIRRFGLGLVERSGPLKRRFMAEARGESGELPKLLLGETV